jgi:decaprenylphospho-beta-D-ribofuranose 2-oxidase
MGRSYGDAAQNAAGAVIDMTSLGCIRDVDLERGTVTAQAGVTLDTLMRRLLPFGWFVPVTPGTRYVTIGGAIAADIHGKNHHRDGSFCDYVESLVLCTPNGELWDISPKNEPDLVHATAGGMGLTGIVVEATMRLIPVSTTWMLVDTERARDFDDLLDKMERRDHAYRYSVAWINCSAGGARLGQAVLTRGDHVRRSDLPAGHTAAMRFEPRARWTLPSATPSGLLRPSVVKAFNECYFRKAPQEKRGELQPMEAFFHPLDGLGHWNRVYGTRGFVQYQMVVPPQHHEVVKEVLERLTHARQFPCLAVLKQMGPQRGLLGFPIEGWTLAVDIPVGSRHLVDALDAIDLMVASAGGRVYLAKDSRMRPDVFRRMYGDLDRWLEIRRQIDPEGKMKSDLARRLEIAGPSRGFRE